MRLIDADTLKPSYIVTSTTTNSLCHMYVSIEDINNAPTVDAVQATMPWIDPDGTERMLDEVSYEIGYSQGQKDAKQQGHWKEQYFDLVSGKVAYACTGCGTHFMEASDYCPKCSARMGGGDAK